MLVGYIRLSRQEPTPAERLALLQQAGCAKVFIDERKGAQLEQPGLYKACALMHPGDTLVVERLACLGCSFKQVVQTIEYLQQRQIGLRTLHEQIDTAGPDGPAQLRVLMAFVACQRSLLRERTQTGLDIARIRGRLGGRRRTMTPTKVAQAVQLRKNPALSVQQICQTLGISIATLYRYVSPTGEVRQT